jgi:predicted ATPase
MTDRPFAPWKLLTMFRNPSTTAKGNSSTRHTSLDECREAYRVRKEEYAEIGYTEVTQALALGPNDERINLLIEVYD